ncbi:MAG: transcription elongation factor GreB [Proteobacteria bacterium]|nr:transcription elongation factor GreB [Pseudomonadota bacterium]
MSKAFTKESDFTPEVEADDDDDESSLPSGFKNYMTPQGLKKLQDELYQIKHVERVKVTEVVSWAASNGDRSENADYHYGKKKLRELDRRIRYLTKRIESAEVVEYLKNSNKDKVFFGATVTVRNEDDSKNTYTIVGIDEIDLDKGRISWISPIANALVKAEIGDFVSFKTPKGIREIEVIDIQYLNFEI